MTDSNSNSTDISVHSLLDDATAVLEDLGIELEDAEEADEVGIDLETDTDSDADAEEGLPEPLASSDLSALAQSAHDLLEERDVGWLLEEIGFDDVDEDAPESIPEAVLAGDPGDVATLRGVQRLARLVEIQDEGESAESVEETVADLRTILARRRDEIGEDAMDSSQNESSDEVGDQDDVEGESDTDAEADSSDETDDGEAMDDESDEISESEDDGIGSSITDALEQSVSEFGDEIEAVQAGLEAVGADNDSGAADDGGSSGGEGDGESKDAEDDLDAAEDEHEDLDATEDEHDDVDAAEEEAGASETDDDDGLLGGSDNSRRRGTMYSTVPLSPSKRTDMKAVKRHSTVPDRR